MARGVNKVILIGNLGADPEVKYTPSGSAVTNVNLATNESWTDRNGERQERVEWHRLVFWSKLAEIAGQYLRKGSKVYIEGRLQTRQWDDQQGQKRYTTEIVVNDMEMLDGRGDGMDAGGPPGRGGPSGPGGQDPQGAQGSQGGQGFQGGSGGGRQGGSSDPGPGAFGPASGGGGPDDDDLPF